MGSLTLHDVRKSFGSVDVLKGIDLEVGEGEFVVFVGPSGCGKSTLLRIIAGLEDATSGSILINGREVNSVPPAKRGIAMVFQTYALYPHLNVRDNMSLGLKQAGMAKAEIGQRVDKVASMLSMKELIARRPAELSGGQRQRVAIGRAIVREPDLFLFDEPLSNLDAALRAQTRLEIAKLHDHLKATMVYVTHDQVEAMTLADRIVVLNGGVIQQVGSPMELYNNPANLFVAGFIGSPRMNFIPGIHAGRGSIHTVGVRPEHITLDPDGGDLEGTVTHVEYLGADTIIYLECKDVGLIIVRNFGEQRIENHKRLFARFDPRRVMQFNADGSRS
ncbi:MAG: glycerol-3-phosphate ABC transporter ATPase [Hoeflea sp. BRH_c9]|nr:MAG: glycerol-3-phosphate ABC transporter ATPase [Hoeflea sp. BRH_c9]